MKNQIMANKGNAQKMCIVFYSGGETVDNIIGETTCYYFVVFFININNMAFVPLPLLKSSPGAVPRQFCPVGSPYPVVSRAPSSLSSASQAQSSASTVLSKAPPVLRSALQSCLLHRQSCLLHRQFCPVRSQSCLVHRQSSSMHHKTTKRFKIKICGY